MIGNLLTTQPHLLLCLGDTYYDHDVKDDEEDGAS